MTNLIKDEDKLIGDKTILRPKELKDAVKDYLWRRDIELSAFDAIPPVNVPFNIFLKSFIEELNSPIKERYILSMDTHAGIHIGNCMYYNIDEIQSDVEIGIVIGERVYQDKGYGTEAIQLLQCLLFRQNKFFRIHLKTLDTNIRAQRCFLNCGFIPCGELCHNGHNFQLMEITLENWLFITGSSVK